MTAPFRAIGGGFKSFTMRWTGSRSWSGWLMPRSKFQYGAEVRPEANSIVVATVGWMARTFPEAPVAVYEVNEQSERSLIVRHPMVRLIEQPNPYYSGVLMWMATISDWAMTGNGYWLKLRNALDEVVQLWWAPSWTMEPEWPAAPAATDVFISHYDYRPSLGMSPIRIEPRDVVHFRYGMDPKNTRKGLAPMASLLREIFTDDEAANFTASLLRNLGVPGVVISPDGGAVQGDPEEIKKTFMAKFGGDKRGEPMVMTGPTKVQVLAFSPEQMLLKELRRVPEERVTAVLGVAAVIVGLGAGLDRSTFNNMAEAREAAYESNMIPSQRLCSADLQLQLLPDFDTGPALEVGFDLSRVRVLQPDVDKLYERLDRGVRGGWVKVITAQRAAGLPVDETQDFYLRAFNIVPMLPGQTASPVMAAGKGVKAVGAAFGEQMAQLRGLIAERHTAAIEEFFREQRARVEGRMSGILGNGKAAISARMLLPDSEDEALAEALRPLWTSGMEEAWRASSSMFGIEGDFDAEGVQAAAALAGGAVRARRILAGSRASIDEAFQEGALRGYSLKQVMDGVDEDGFDGISRRVESYYTNRPATVARTEAMWATNQGSAALYRNAGYSKVEMVDGGDDEACARRNGAVVSLAAGLAATNVEHPNGTLSLAPVA